MTTKIQEKPIDVSSIDINFLRLNTSTINSFRELLNYHLTSKKPLNFKKFSIFTGISKLQWDDFKLKYKDILKFEMFALFLVRLPSLSDLVHLLPVRAIVTSVLHLI